MSRFWPWLALAGLGAYHGLNPAMGWLFAVALGMQEKSRRAVLLALPPIALGHAISIGAVVGLLGLARASVPERPLRYGAAAVLFAFALDRLIRARHPNWVGMRVGFRDLTLWSFLMASAHGAGLMLVPVLLAWPASAQAAGFAAHEGHHLLFRSWPAGGTAQTFAAVGLHSAAYLLVAALIAMLVYEKLGVEVLRYTWFNLDRVWGIALLVSSAFLVMV